MMRIFLASAALFFLAACAQATDRSAYELTEEAQKILRETGRDEFSEEAMQLLERAVAEDPNHLPARQERLNLFLLENDVSAAVEEAGEIVRIRDIPETRLFLCMLREFENQDFPGLDSCYSDVASAIASRTNTPHANLNYVLALRLSDDPDFQAAAEKHIGNIEIEEIRVLTRDLLFEKPRAELIKSYIPGQ